MAGLLLSIDGPRTDVNDITRYSYYPSTDESGCGTLGGACHRAGDPYQVTDALGHATTAAAYDKAGRLVRQVDAAGVPTDYSYTPRGWLRARTVRAAATGTSSSDATTTIDYDAVGNVIKITDPDGVFTGYTYDAAHRLTDITDVLGNVIHYTLDAAGDKTAETVSDAQGKVWRSLARRFNALGQLVNVTDGLGHTTFDASANGDYDGNGNLVHSTDALGIQRQLGYDALNRLAQTIDNYNGADPATHDTTTAYTYDSLDRLTQLTDPGHLTTTYSYDGLSDATDQISPDTGTTRRTFDAAGNMLTRTDANGITATITYDGLNRPLTVSYPDSSQNIAYHYDEANRVTGCPSTTAPIGRLTRIVEANVTTVFCPDPHGNLIERNQITASGTDYTEMSYTPGDRLSHRIYPDGANASYRRNANGQISAIDLSPPHRGASPAVSNVSYLPFGPISSYTLGNGQTITRGYDANQRLTDLTSPALNLHYARDAMGNITAQGDAPGAANPTEAYRYDPLYRLTQLSADGTAQESVTYNATGDRTGKSGSGLATGNYGYQANTHWLTSTGNAARTYDANGNTTGASQAGQTFGYGYNGRNRLTVVQAGGSTVGAYTYNALGERIQKTAGVTTTRFIYDDDQHLLTAEATGSNARDYVWLDELPVAVIDSVNGSARAIDYVTADALGTPRAISNTTSATVWQWSSTGNAWGEATPGSNGYVFNLRYPGQYFDAESGLVYNDNRDYDPPSGRYWQPDPIGQAAGPSLYAYVGGNPLSNIDPWGLSWIYHQNTGQLQHVNDATGDTTNIGAGYSGNGAGLNNSAMQNVPNVGPIPQGAYDIGAGHYSPTTGPNTMNLTPQENTNTYGRDLFRIHGDNSAYDHTASEGCIVTAPQVRRLISNGADRVLQVVP